MNYACVKYFLTIVGVYYLIRFLYIIYSLCDYVWWYKNSNIITLSIYSGFYSYNVTSFKAWMGNQKINAYKLKMLISLKKIHNYCYLIFKRAFTNKKKKKIKIYSLHIYTYIHTYEYMYIYMNYNGSNKCL